MTSTSLKRLVFVSVNAVRWWCGLGWFAGGIGAIIWSPVELSKGDRGGIYLLIGGIVLLALAWIVHPWGLSRRQARASNG